MQHSCVRTSLMIDSGADGFVGANAALALANAGFVDASAAFVYASAAPVGMSAAVVGSPDQPCLRCSSPAGGGYRSAGRFRVLCPQAETSACFCGRFAFCAPFLWGVLFSDGGTSCRSFVFKWVAECTHLTTLYEPEDSRYLSHVELQVRLSSRACVDRLSDKRKGSPLASLF